MSNGVHLNGSSHTLRGVEQRLSLVYSREPPCNPLLSFHTDIYVGDVLTPSDIDDHELGRELFSERYRWARP